MLMNVRPRAKPRIQSFWAIPKNFLRRVEVVCRSFAPAAHNLSAPAAHNLGAGLMRPCREMMCGVILGAMARIAPQRPATTLNGSAAMYSENRPASINPTHTTNEGRAPVRDSEFTTV